MLLVALGGVRTARAWLLTLGRLVVMLQIGARAADGANPMIAGRMQGANSQFCRRRHLDLLAGLRVSVAPIGRPNGQLAIEASVPLLQNLNAPQPGRSWESSRSRLAWRSEVPAAGPTLELAGSQPAICLLSNLRHPDPGRHLYRSQRP